MASTSRDSSTFDLSETSCWHYCAGVPKGRAVILRVFPRLCSPLPKGDPRRRGAARRADPGSRSFRRDQLGPPQPPRRALGGARWEAAPPSSSAARGVQVRLAASRGRAEWQVPLCREVEGKFARGGGGSGCCASGAGPGRRGESVGGGSDGAVLAPAARAARGHPLRLASPPPPAGSGAGPSARASGARAWPRRGLRCGCRALSLIHRV